MFPGCVAARTCGLRDLPPHPRPLVQADGRLRAPQQHHHFLRASGRGSARVQARVGHSTVRAPRVA